MTKTVIVGTNHAGIAAANTLLDNFPDQEVVMIDRNDNLSYLGCGTALWVGRQIDSYEGLFYTKREDFESKGARISMETTVDRSLVNSFDTFVCITFLWLTCVSFNL